MSIKQIYKKLLKIGQRKLKGSVPNDVESHAKIDELYNINKYAYTYYSTNEEDPTMSLEFVILAEKMDSVLKKCKQRGLWYVAKRFDDSTMQVHVDPELSAKTETTTMQVTKLSNMIIKTAKNPDGWEINRKDGPVYHLVRQTSIHFLSPSYVDDLLVEYENSDVVMNWWDEQIQEASDDLTETEFIDLIPHLAIITLEDPQVGRLSLYKEVYQILADSNSRSNSRSKSRKSRKSRSKN